MIGTTGTAAQTNGSAPKSKELRKKYGVQKRPLEVAAGTVLTMRKKCNFDEKFSDPNSPEYVGVNAWLVINEQTNTVRRATTYNGNLGDNEDYLDPSRLHQLPVKGSKDWRKMIKGYEVCDLATLPFVIVTGDEQNDEQNEGQPERELTGPLQDELNDDGAPADESSDDIDALLKQNEE